MSEYGHNAINGTWEDGTAIHVDSWGSGPFVIEVEGKSFRFEDSDRFGPSLVKRNGAICANPWPPERSAFWLAHACWRKQGRKIAEDSVTCVYELIRPRPTTYYKIGRTMFVVQGGDEGGGYIEVPKPVDP